MSEVLAIVDKGRHGICPTFKVRCACGRVYQTTSSRVAILRKHYCKACCPSQFVRGVNPRRGYRLPVRCPRPFQHRTMLVGFT